MPQQDSHLSAKEREILQRQRQLASRLKPAFSSNSEAASTARKPKPPPPPPPRANNNSNKNNAPTSFFAKYGMKPPATVAGSHSTSSSSSKKTAPQTQRPSSSSSRQQPPPPPQHKRPSSSSQNTSSTAPVLNASRPIRPTLKNKRKLQQAAAAVAAQQQSQHQQSQEHPSSSNNDKTSPLPVVKKKARTDASSTTTATPSSSSASSSTTSTSGPLAQWVQKSSSAVARSSEAAVFATIEPDDYWKNLREWDFCQQYTHYHAQSSSSSASSRTNHKNKYNNDESALTTTRPLPNTFFSVKQYMAQWAPLCMAECRGQLLQEAAQTRIQPYPVSVEVMKDNFKAHRNSAVVTNDHNWDAIEVDSAIHLKINPLPHGKRGSQQQPNVMANDLCILVDRSDFLASPSSSVHGLVTHAQVTRQKSLSHLIVKAHKRFWAKYGKVEMYLMVVANNVTAWREFTALCQLDQLPLKRFLLGEHLEKQQPSQSQQSNHQSTANPLARLSTRRLLEKMGGKDALGKGFLDYASNKFNSSQLTAIAASAHEYGEGGFTLIKGPPGTGKTTTLVAVLNSLHIRQYNKYYAEVRRIAAESNGSRQNALQMARKAKPRLLVCAPSNAAVDNIILKIMEDGFIDGQGQRYNPSMIRVGVGKSAAVKAVALETKVDNILGENLDAGKLDASIAAYRVELARITQDIHRLRQRVQAMTTACPWPLSRDWEIRIDDAVFDETGNVYFVNHRDKSTTYEVPPPPEPDETQFPATSMPEYRAYISRIVKLVESYFSIKTHLERCTVVKSGHDQGANQFDVRMNLESHVLNDVHIVMTTLGTAGNRVLEGADKFEVVVVDEAAQSVEPATLAALQLGSRHAVLVGDPQQLPATIFNVSGRNSKYDRSLFQRLEEAGQAVYMLNEQYRMHPEISHFPRHIFYGGNLKDGPNVKKEDYGNPLRAVLNCAVPDFKPLTILDLDSSEERGGTSLSNRQEGQLAVFLYQKLTEYARDLCTKSKVAVITPYSQQVALLRRLFKDSLGPRYENLVEINSVDAFQGREANIVIFSAVRAAGSKGIGFLSDVRRMNVALTRAKHFLFVIARCQSIVVNPYWRDLVQHARETHAVLRVPKLSNNGNQLFASPTSWQLEGGPRKNKEPDALDQEEGEIDTTIKEKPPPPPPPPPKRKPVDPRKKNHEHRGEYKESRPALLDSPSKAIDPRLTRKGGRKGK